MPPPVDVAQLEEFSDGSPAAIREVVGLFLAHSQDALGELGRAVEAGDAAAIRMLAHRTGGSSSVCGAKDLAALLRCLEVPPAGNRSMVEDAAVLRAVIVEFSSVKRFLDAYVEGLPE